MSNQSTSSTTQTALSSQIQKLTEHKIHELSSKIEQLKIDIEKVSTDIEYEENLIMQSKKMVTQNLTRSITSTSPSISFQNLEDFDLSKIQMDIQNFLQNKYL